MEDFTVKDVVAMLAVIYKRMDDLESKIKGHESHGYISLDSHLKDLKKQADSIKM